MSHYRGLPNDPPMYRMMAIYPQYRHNRYAGKRPRYRCTECSAQFWDVREESKMWMHARQGFHDSFGHGGFRATPSKHAEVVRED